MDALKSTYSAFNRDDIPATVPNIEWTEPPEFPRGGTYYGHAGVQAYLSQSRANWAEGSSEPEHFLIAGDKIIVFVHVRVRLRDSRE
ncbi:MAG TPA: nuclear transport factor 2 family protein [Candidatus Acidoferrum sp.]|nr:nuclear transport factor 2 family protein [Candidatus Acidoferrum sp.]